jgi:LPXTG-motif cell wall-anchored protein
MTGTGTDVGASPPAARDDFPFADELARTGITVPLAALTAGLLLLAGTAVLLLVRRRR